MPAGDILAAPLTQLGAFLGTPRYMAPEQRQGLPATARSDQFAFCVALWEALAGEHPFAPLDAETPRPFPRGRAPGWLVRVLETGLAMDPALRHASMAELVSLLETTPARRRRAALTAAVLALSAAVIVVLAVMYRRAERAAREAHDRLVDSWVEQGRQALLDGDPQRSLSFLAQAMRAGADDDAIRFMVARGQRAVHKRTAAIPAHHGRISYLAVSPDRTRLISTGEDGTARLWDAATRTSLATVTHHARTLRAHFDPRGDRAVSLSDDDTAIVWDAHDGHVLTTVVDKDVHDAALTSDGQLVTWTMDHFVVWSLPEGRELLRETVTAPITAAASPIAPRLIVSSGDEHILWDTSTWRPISRTRHERATPGTPDFAPAGGGYATSTGARAELWDADGVRVRELVGHSRNVPLVTFSRDGARLLTMGVDRRIRVWNVADAALLATLDGGTGLVTWAGFDPAGALVLGGSDDGTARIWNASTGGLVTSLHTAGQALQPYFLAGATQVVIGGEDGALSFWDARPDDLEADLTGHTGFALFATFLPDGSVASAGEDGLLLVHDAHGAVSRSLQLGDQAAPGRSRLMTVSRDRLVMAVEGGFTVRDLDSGAVLHTVETPAVTWIAASADGQRLATAGYDGVVRVWTRDGELVSELQRHTAAVEFVGFDPAGARLLSGSADTTAIVWDLAARAPALVLTGHTRAVQAGAFSSDGALIATGSDDRTAIVWSAAGARVATLTGHHGGIDTIAFVPGRDLILTGSIDAAVNVWTASGGRLLYRFPVGATLTGLALDARGTRVATPSGLRDLPIWDLRGDDRPVAAILADLAVE